MFGHASFNMSCQKVGYINPIVGRRLRLYDYGEDTPRRHDGDDPSNSDDNVYDYQMNQKQ
jgi:hypothetical protein